MRRLSLSSRVTLFTMLGLCVVWVLAVALLAYLLVFHGTRPWRNGVAD